jgi:hypothetical protein
MTQTGGNDLSSGGPLYETACLCRVGARGSVGGAALPLALVWIAVGAGLLRGRLRRRPR